MPPARPSQPAKPAPSATAAWLVGLALVMVTFALYWPVRTHGFVGIDDPDYVSENFHVNRGFSRDGIAWAFHANDAANWHPLTWLSHTLDCQLFGLNAGAHHLVNVALHALNAVLLFAFLRRATGAFWRAAFIAACFAWHPLRVESVAWIAERKDVLSGCFGLLTLLAYVRYAQLGDKPPAAINRGKYFTLALACFALGLMSKPMLVTLPCALLLLDFWPLNRMPLAAVKHAGSHSNPFKTFGRLCAEKIPFFLLSAVSCALTIWAQGAGHAIGSTQQFPLLTRVANALVACGKYVEKTLWPAKLAIFYPYPAETPWAFATAMLLGLAAIAFLGWRWRAQRPQWLVGWLWFFGMLVPVIGLVQVGGQSWADRYSYLPTIGLLIAVVWFAAEFAARHNAQRLLGAAAVVLLVAWAFVTTKQVHVWRDSRVLFEHARNVTERNYLAWTVLGGYLGREGKLPEAIQHYETALQMLPDYSGALTGMGNVHEKLGQYEPALDFYNRALQTSPYDAEIVNGKATVLARLGRFAEAEAGLLDSLKLRPGYGEAVYNLGSIQQRQGRTADALVNLQRAAALMPQSTNVHFTLGETLRQAQRPADALAAYDRALQLAPQWSEARYGRALALMDLGRVPEAGTEFKSLVEVMKNRAAALDGYGFALALQGQAVEAEKLFQEALRVDPKQANAHLHYAMQLAGQRKLTAAVEHYRACLATETNQPAALNNLAWILAASSDASLRNGLEAVTLARRACELTGHREPFFLGTLAAAYAESGDFPNAIASAERAQAIATAAGRPDMAQRNEELLKFYRAGQPYHEPPAAP